MFDNNFDDILQEADKKYQSKKKDYGESWKNMTVEQLFKRRDDELMEEDSADDLEDQYHEVMDSTIVSLMLLKQIKKQIEE